MHFVESKPAPAPYPCHPQSPMRPAPLESPRAAAAVSQCDDADACALAAVLAADALDVPLADVLAATRGSRPAAHARQVAMYLAHVALGVPLAAAGRCFGRDHSTVAHGCGRVEDLRDEPSFDQMIAELALAARIARRLDREVLA